MTSWQEQLSNSRMLDRGSKRHVPELWSATSGRGMVASAHYKATEAGVETLSKGGNAFDAADSGFKDFYHGDVAREIIEGMRRNGGLVCEEAFAEIPWPRESVPVRGRFCAMEVCSLTPPGDEQTLVQMLQVFELLKGPGIDPDTPEAAALFARIIQEARKDRRRHRLGSRGAAGNAVDRAGLEYARRVSEKLGARMTGPGETPRFCVMDGSGNAVFATQSIERSFGAKVAAESLGFLYNGYMKGFKIKNKRHPHHLQPGAVARSNAAPTILFQGGHPAVAIGSTGSERMVSGIFQTLVRLQGRLSHEKMASQTPT